MWAPYDPISYFLHIGFGTIAIAGAVVALSVRKGSPLHKKAGWIFLIPMTVAALTAFVFEIEIETPRPLAIVMSVATLYLLATSILSLRNGTRGIAIAEKALVVIPLALFAFSAAFLAQSIQSGAMAQIPGPMLYASLFLALVIGDFRKMLSPTMQRQARIKRHLLRMLLAFAFAIRALFSIGIDSGLPFEFVVTAPIVLALGAAWFFFRRVRASESLSN